MLTGQPDLFNWVPNGLPLRNDGLNKAAEYTRTTCAFCYLLASMAIAFSDCGDP
jgi:hypothetical protein